jgi:hypothetical protein
VDPVAVPVEPTPAEPASPGADEQPEATPAHHFVLRLEEGESTAEMAQVQVHLAVEPADADLTRKGIRTALLELEHSGNLVVPEPFNLSILAGPAAPGVGVRAVAQPPNQAGDRSIRAMLINWNDTLIKPGHIATIQFRRAGAGPYALKWKQGAQATGVTPSEANETLDLKDATFDFAAQ